MGSDRKERELSSVVRAFEIIEHLRETDAAGVTALAGDLEMPKSTVHSHLKTLESKGYVVREDGEYRLSLRFLSLGEHVKRAQPLYRAAKGPVEDLAERTGEHVTCMTEENGLGTVVCAGHGERSLATGIDVGTNVYLQASAGGKTILAHLSRERVDQIIDRWGLPSFTDETITDRETLYEELDAVRERGIAFNREEYLRGVLAVGAPILADDGAVHGAVTVVGPARRLYSDRDESELHDRLLATTNTIEVNLLFSEGEADLRR